MATGDVAPFDVGLRIRTKGLDMYRFKITVIAMFLCVLTVMQTQAQSEDKVAVDNKIGTRKIAVTNLDVNDKTLKLSYEIINDSKKEVWICDSVHERYNFEVYLEEDSQILTIRKLLGVPSLIHWYSQPSGKYMRLCPGKKRTESLVLALPVNSVNVYKSKGSKQLHRVVNAKRLAIEIGCYVGELPEMFFDMLKETEKTDLDKMITFNHWFGGVLGFNYKNEQLRHRDEEVLIPYTQQKLDNEKVLRIIIDDLSIPYKETIRRPKYIPPDLTTCTRVEIQCEPSMLEYFYPYQSQKALLSKEEMEYLQSEKSISVEDSQKINDFANEIKQEKYGTGGIVSEKNKANVICYRDGRRVTSFIVYDNSSIETKQKQRIKYFNGLTSMRTLTPQIQPFELRIQCASNLKNLWYRLRFYDRAEKTRVQSYSSIKLDETNKLDNSNKHDDPDASVMDKTEELFHEAQLFFEAAKKRMADLYPKIKLIFPAPRRWCDALEWAFAGTRVRSRRHEVDLIMKFHVCPSVGEGENHYAMNSKCRPDSPPDMVLLFETKAGWNQHGGTELFTFDNHNPKGGCVLLNDGTVKFIRTKEELQQLRWK
ncbi:MAG: hypothetical protein ACETWQ_21565 [Phycisphaerae bacterium]